MFKLDKTLTMLTLLTAALSVCGQARRSAQIGYLYPAGGQCGETVEIVVGGQRLGGATLVYVSGTGVSATTVHHFSMPPFLRREQRQLLIRQLFDAADNQLAVMGLERPVPRKPPLPEASQNDSRADNTDYHKLPDDPRLQCLKDKNLRELAHIEQDYFNSQWRIQRNPQLAERLLLRVEIAPDAEPGERELRIITPAGISNAMVFQVDTLPEVRESEPNDTQAYPKLTHLPRGWRLPVALTVKETAFELPLIFNGQIMPGDVDRFRFYARKGQKIIVKVSARMLNPYLADAVPGWFQAVVAVFDDKNQELAFADDFHFNPDPVVFFEPPADGEYELEIRDAIYRGREDFVYRIAVGELPFITHIFPLGACAGSNGIVNIGGWNLPFDRLSLNTSPGEPEIRRFRINRNNLFSNFVSYAVGELPEIMEVEPNDTLATAQAIALPAVINGRIERPGDVDFFAFAGRAGEMVTAEIQARRLDSPLDAHLMLVDDTGTILAHSDDQMIRKDNLHKNINGLQTHHADSLLTTTLPRDGVYLVRVAEIQRQGGNAWSYRLRLSPPRPDFTVAATPSVVEFNERFAGQGNAIALLDVFVERREGFTGDIEIVAKDYACGLTIDGGVIPEGADRITLSLTAPGELAPDLPHRLQLIGRAKIDGKAVERPVIPVDERMQAFLYRHLVPLEEFQAWVLPRAGLRKIPAFCRFKTNSVSLLAGGTTEIAVDIGNRWWLSFREELEFELINPPEGISYAGSGIVANGMLLKISVDSEIAPETAGNLIICAFRHHLPPAKEGQPPPNKKVRRQIGIFPALPFIVYQEPVGSQVRNSKN